eukprot:SAG31_NODE_15546_length_750_cov_1.306154_1_plen_73_part_00
MELEFIFNLLSHFFLFRSSGTHSAVAHHLPGHQMAATALAAAGRATPCVRCDVAVADPTIFGSGSTLTSSVL